MYTFFFGSVIFGYFSLINPLATLGRYLRIRDFVPLTTMGRNVRIPEKVFFQVPISGQIWRVSADLRVVDGRP